MTEQAPPRSCPNCGTPAAGRYCPGCGQDNTRPRLEMRAVLLEAFHNLVGWDTALGRTLRGLVRNPGGLVEEYVSGRRRRFVNPARFCLLAIALWMVLVRVLGVDALDISGITFSGFEEEGMGGPGGEVPFVLLLKGSIARNLSLLLYISLPLRALLLHFAFRKSGWNLAENMVLVLYMAGFGYLIAFLTTPLMLLGVPSVIDFKNLVSFCWFYRATRRFHGRGWYATLWRALLVTFGHMLGTVLLIGTIAVPWALWLRG